jgi:hypothetical protein
MHIEWNSPFTPHHLLQEQYYPDRWRVAVICIMLNCTSRKQVEPVAKLFFEHYPDAPSYIRAYTNSSDLNVLHSLLKSLGFKARRAERLYKFSVDYTNNCPIASCFGIGEYANTCDQMYFEKNFETTPPKDGALVKVWNWIVNLECAVLEKMNLKFNNCLVWCPRLEQKRSSPGDGDWLLHVITDGELRKLSFCYDKTYCGEQVRIFKRTKTLLESRPDVYYMRPRIVIHTFDVTDYHATMPEERDKIEAKLRYFREEALLWRGLALIE